MNKLTNDLVAYGRKHMHYSCALDHAFFLCFVCIWLWTSNLYVFSYKYFHNYIDFMFIAKIMDYILLVLWLCMDLMLFSFHVILRMCNACIINVNRWRIQQSPHPLMLGLETRGKPCIQPICKVPWGIINLFPLFPATS